MIKSTQQQGKSVPRITLLQGVLAGARAAPIIGSIIGAQMITQEFVEKKIFTPPKEGQKPSLSTMLSSSVIVGALSAPGLAVFNGQSMGKTAMQSLKGLSTLQVAAIISRESLFLLSMRASKPASDYMKKRFGDSSAIVYGSAFASGSFGSIISQPADTLLTCWQNGIKVTNFSQAMRGGPVKAATVGTFAMIYPLVKEKLTAILS